MSTERTRYEEEEEERRRRGPGNRNVLGEALYAPAPVEVPPRGGVLFHNPIVDFITQTAARVPKGVTLTGQFLPYAPEPTNPDEGLPPLGGRRTLEGRNTLMRQGPGVQSARTQALLYGTDEDLQTLLVGAPPAQGGDTITDQRMVDLVRRAMQGDQSILIELLSEVAPYTFDEVSGKPIGGGLSARGQYISDILDAAVSIQREDARQQQAQQQAVFQAALANPFAFGALNALMGRNYAPLVGGLPSIGFQMPQQGGNLFPGGIPTLGALNQAGPEGLSFLQALLGFQGVSPYEIGRTAGSVTPAAFQGLSTPFGGGRERPVSPFTLPAPVAPRPVPIPSAPERALEAREAREAGGEVTPAPSPAAGQVTPPSPAPAAPLAAPAPVALSPLAQAAAMYKAMLDRGEITPEQYDSLIGSLLGGE